MHAYNNKCCKLRCANAARHACFSSLKKYQVLIIECYRIKVYYTCKTPVSLIDCQAAYYK